MREDRPAGKGDRYRPVNQAKYAANYDKIFRERKREKQKIKFLHSKLEDK